ncbi:MAG: hemolysin family protein [Dehalococcoidia bacterium]
MESGMLIADSIILSLILLFVSIFIMAFFTSSETAFISLQKFRLRHLVSTEKNTRAKRVAKIMKRTERFLTTVLVGTNFAHVAAASLGTAIAISLIGGKSAVLIATAAVTILLLIFAEIGPKTLAARHGERMALMYGHPIEVLIKVFYPIIVVFEQFGNQVARLAGGKHPTQTLINEDEIRAAIMTGVEEGMVEKTEAKMLSRVFEFGDRRVVEVMTPRPEIAWVESGITLADFLLTYSQTPHSRIPVYEDTIENVVGILWMKDVLMAQAKGEISAESSISKLARPASFVPESKLVKELFTEMQEAGRQIALVVDEFGGITGLVTMEQLLEEIVGDMGDELRGTERTFQTIDERAFEIDGSMRIDEANEELGLKLPKGDYETVAGLILNLLGHIPREGEGLKHGELTLVIKEMKGVKVGKILVRSD